MVMDMQTFCSIVKYLSCINFWQQWYMATVLQNRLPIIVSVKTNMYVSSNVACWDFRRDKRPVIAKLMQQ